MIPASHKITLSALLIRQLDSQQEIGDLKSAGGGNINETYSFNFGTERFFLKANSAKDFPSMFEKEKLGLEELAKCKAVVIPRVILIAEIESRQYLVLKHLERIPETDACFAGLGAGLASLHKIKSESFGFSHDNYIGSLVQSNGITGTWQEFFTTQRLEPLVKWCYDEKYISQAVLRCFENLYSQLSSVFPNEQPALLHGDLWSGNKMNTSAGPSVFDPSVYYGHREMDIAMSKLFGGFGPAFYEAYNAEYPLEKNYLKRVDICNLYPLLVHVKLFGTAYLHDVVAIIKRF